MITLVILPLLILYSPAAVWAFRSGGSRRLWVLCAAGILAIVAVSVGSALAYDVPSIVRVVVVFLAFCGPPLLLASGFLSVWRPSNKPVTQLGVAVAGNTIGLAIGWIAIVYGIGVW